MTLAPDTRTTERTVLPLPPEPVSERQRFEAEMISNRWLAVANLRRGAWLTPDLWRLWEPWLRQDGLTEHDLQDRISDSSPYFLHWIEHDMEWGQAIANLTRTLQPHSAT